jgi:hypothetical protein
MRKVYIVESSAGSYDDYCWWICGIYEDAQTAEDHKSKVLYEIERCKSAKCPIIGVEDYNDMPIDAPESDWLKFDKWSQEKYDADDFNWCRVKEVELNKELR